MNNHIQMEQSRPETRAEWLAPSRGGLPTLQPGDCSTRRAMDYLGAHPEVTKLHLPSRVHQHVGRLHVCKQNQRSARLSWRRTEIVVIQIQALVRRWLAWWSLIGDISKVCFNCNLWFVAVISTGDVAPVPQAQQSVLLKLQVTPAGEGPPGLCRMGSGIQSNPDKWDWKNMLKFNRDKRKHYV